MMFIDNVRNIFIDDIQEIVYFYIDGSDELKSVSFDDFRLSNVKGM